MAQSKSFFGLRAGSTKSLTFSVYRGKQITKDRVYMVRNPKTTAQRLQRMKLAAASVLYRYFKEPITRGQEGVEYGNESRLKWLSQLMSQQTVPYTFKNDKSLHGWPAPLTSGSLPEISCTLKEGDTIVTGLYVAAAGSELNGTQLLAKNKNLQSGDQLAFAGIFYKANEPILAHVGSVIITTETTEEEILAAMPDGTAPEFSEASDGKVAINLQTDYAVWQFAIIHSRLVDGKYLRSTAKFDWPMPENDEWKQRALDSWGDVAGAAIADWPDIASDTVVGIDGYTQDYYLQGEGETRTVVNVLLNHAYNGAGQLVEALVLDASGNAVNASGTAIGKPENIYTTNSGTETLKTAYPDTISLAAAKSPN